MYSVFRAVYALIRQLSDSTFNIFFQKIARGADAPFEFFEESLLFSAHFRGLEQVENPCGGLDNKAGHNTIRNVSVVKVQRPRRRNRAEVVVVVDVVVVVRRPQPPDRRRRN